MISTPESGIDSIAISYALLDPVMTIARPVAAFVTAATAGMVENLFERENRSPSRKVDLTCPVDGCCDGIDCDPETHKRHHTAAEKVRSGLVYAFGDLWADMCAWFFAGMLMAGVIGTVVPDEMVSRHLASGLPAMLGMLVAGVPLYICATGSTPIAAALILKGVSPGAALVFLLTGPATNITSLTVLFGILGRRATAIYFVTIAACAVLFGLGVDHVYAMLGISAKASVGRAVEIIPPLFNYSGAAVLLLFSAGPLYHRLAARFAPRWSSHDGNASPAPPPPDHRSNARGCGPT